MRRLVFLAGPLALGLLAGPAAAAPAPSPAKYAAGQRCEDAMADGRNVIRGLPPSRAAWHGDERPALRAFNAVLDQAHQGRRTCEAAFSDADGRDDRAEHMRLRAAWLTHQTEVDRALALITQE